MDAARANELKTVSHGLPELTGWTLPGLNERTIVVTGAGSGIGAATVRGLSSAGARVLGVDRDADGLAATLESVDNDRVETLVADLLDPDAPDAIVGRAKELFGGLTSLVHIAGVNIPAWFPDVTREQFDFQFGVNVYAPFFLTQKALPLLLESQGQVVFCASSSSGYRGAPSMAGYVASKHAVLGVMRSLTMELAPQGIRVNSVSPGTTVSPINDPLFDIPEFLDLVLPSIPSGRIAEPHEHVGAVGYLLSDLALHVNGHDIAVDGGRLAH